MTSPYLDRPLRSEDEVRFARIRAMFRPVDTRRVECGACAHFRPDLGGGFCWQFDEAIRSHERAVNCADFQWVREEECE